MEIRVIKITFVLGLYLFGADLTGKGQKPMIEPGIEDKWATITGSIVTNNGQYIVYQVGDKYKTCVIVQATDQSWKLTMDSVDAYWVSEDNRNAFLLRRDTVFIVELILPHAIKYMTHIGEFSVLKSGNKGNLLVYRLKSNDKELCVEDTRTKRKKWFSGVKNYWDTFGRDNNFLYETYKPDSSENNHALWVYNTATGENKMIWSGWGVDRIVFGDSSFVFVEIQMDNTGNTSIWHYRVGDNRAQKCIDNRAHGIDPGFQIRNIRAFNESDDRVFFTASKEKRKDSIKNAVSVDIWSYKDADLQSEQLEKEKKQSQEYTFLLNLHNFGVVRLENEGEMISSPIYSGKSMRSVLVVKKGISDPCCEWNWNRRASSSVYLLSLADGTRTLIDSNLRHTSSNGYSLSFSENFCFYYNVKDGNYFSYNVITRQRKNMTASVQARWTSYESSDEPDSAFRFLSYRGVVKNSDAILVYDRNDIYLIDPKSTNLVLNLTGDARRKRDLVFRIDLNDDEIIDLHKKVLIDVFDRVNKNEGLVETGIDSIKKLKSFNLLPVSFAGAAPIKAKDTSLFFLSRMTAEESPNIFFTADFNIYQKVSNVHPEMEYNWMNTELISWKTFDGIPTQGILYKPSDFDPQKKYPLIAFYYERMSDRLHYYLKPGPSNGSLNIPLYVSNGYLIFVPDIHYKIGWPGKSAFNSVVSGVKKLISRGYVDSTRLGLQGHSFGGFETNYIITHTRMFTAAMSASGMTDFISAYGSIIRGGSSRQRQYEIYRDRIGATLWGSPNLYIENSPVLRCDKLTTPLLMMANKEDDDVPFQQGMEFFTALRRLNKKVWMLQYDKGGHNVYGPAGQDLTVRMFQFFNYYLKGGLPPQWMTAGVPAIFKGRELGLQLDTSGKKP
jgi:hypothetical protein